MFVAAASRPPTATCRWPASPRSASRPTPRPRPGSTTTSTACSRTRTSGRSATRRRRRTAPRRTRSTSSGTAPAPTRALAQDPGRRTPSTRSSCCTARTTAQTTATATKQDVVIDQSHRHVPDPRHRPRAPTANARTRSIIATFRRDSFLNFVYFTDYENRDPQAATDAADARRSSRPTAPNKYRSARAGQDCTEIQFATGDAINGPLHTNDESLLICGTPAFGRDEDQDGRDVRDRHDRGPRRRARATCANPGPAAATRRRSTRRPASSRPSAKLLELPRVQRAARRRSPRRAAASTRARRHPPQRRARWTSPTTRRRDDDDHRRRGRPTACSTSRTTAPATARSRPPPTTTSQSTCGNVYVSGTYSQVADDRGRQRRDHPPDGGAARQQSTTGHHPGRRHGRDARADRQQLRARRPPGRPQHGLRRQLIDAPVRQRTSRSRRRSCRCSTPSSSTTTTAARAGHAQRHRRDRAEVPRPGRHRQLGDGIATGFLKNYWYDDRFRYRSPPYFLTRSTPPGTSCARTRSSRAPLSAPPGR